MFRHFMPKSDLSKSPVVRGVLCGSKRKGRRETIYKMLKKKCNGVVPCFVCKNHVEWCDSTLEHIFALSKGGSDDMDNLSISHEKCNKLKGSK